VEDTSGYDKSRIHQQNVFLSLGASGSIWELSDQNPRVVKSQSRLDRCSGLQVHLGAPGSAGEKPRSADDKSGSTSNHSRAVWEKHRLLWERCWCAWTS